MGVDIAFLEPVVMAVECRARSEANTQVCHHCLLVSTLVALVSAGVPKRERKDEQTAISGAFGEWIGAVCE